MVEFQSHFLSAQIVLRIPNITPEMIAQLSLHHYHLDQTENFFIKKQLYDVNATHQDILNEEKLLLQDHIKTGNVTLEVIEENIFNVINKTELSKARLVFTK